MAEIAANTAHLPTDWNSILSTTLHNYRKTLTDNIFNARPLLHYLLSKGRVRRIQGGVTIVEPVIYTENTEDTGSYGQWDLLTVTPQEGISAAQFPWSQIATSIAISGLEEAQNNGQAAITNLLEAKIMQAEGSLKNSLSAMLYAATTGTGDFTSLYELVDDVTPTGGIDPADTNAGFWVSQTYDHTAATLDAGELEATMRTGFNSASDSGTDRIDSMFMAQDVFEFYESTLTPQVRYTDTEKANLGFMNLMFKNVPCFWDFDATANDMFGLNSKYVGMCIHSDRDFAQSKFTDNLSGMAAGAAGGTPGQPGTAAGNTIDARVAWITTFGNMTIRNRRRCAKWENIVQTPPA